MVAERTLSSGRSWRLRRPERSATRAAAASPVARNQLFSTFLVQTSREVSDLCEEGDLPLSSAQLPDVRRYAVRASYFSAGHIQMYATLCHATNQSAEQAKLTEGVSRRKRSEASQIPGQRDRVLLAPSRSQCSVDCSTGVDKRLFEDAPYYDERRQDF